MAEKRPSFDGADEIQRIWVGRHRELAALRSWGKRNPHPLIVTGPPGTGKTMLVRMYTHVARDEYAQVIHALGHIFQSVEAVAPFIAAELARGQHTPEATRKRAPLAEAFRRLSAPRHTDKPVLVVLDGIDEISDSASRCAELVAAVCRTRPSMRWLLTSRESTFDLLSHRPTPQEPLRAGADFEILRLADLSDSEIHDLLQRRLSVAKADPSVASRLVELVRQRDIGGNPLLITLLAAQFVSTADFDASLDRFEAQLSRPLTNLFLLQTGGQTTAVPLAQMPLQQVVMPTGIVVPTAPYVIVPGLRAFWRNQLAEFEGLLNDPKAQERDYQAFFEKYPHFLRGIDYERVLPHPVLEREAEGQLIPDFFLQPCGRKYADVLDLKLPTEDVIVGQKNRLRFSGSVQEALAQVREYRDYFEEPKNRISVEAKYGLTAYRPSCVVIIGRRPRQLSEEKLRQVYEPLPKYLKVVTYDDLFMKMCRIASLPGA